MTSAEENRVRKPVHGFLHSDIRATEFREELDRITGGKKHKKDRRAASGAVGTPPRTVVQNRAVLG
jgi:hypothetical protein